MDTQSVFPFEIVWKGGRFQLRHLERSELSLVDDLIKTVEWPVSREDLECHYNVGPRSFYGLLDQNGKLITTILVHQATETSSFIGIFITAPEFRGQGIGRQLFSHMTQKFSCKNLALVAVSSAVKFYESFEFIQSKLGSNQVIRIHNASSPNRYHGNIKEIEVGKVTCIEQIGRLAEYDQAVTGAERGRYVENWIFSPGRSAYMATRNGNCVGYGAFSIRKTYVRVQPLYADSSDVAISLVQAFLEDHGKVELMILYLVNGQAKEGFVHKLAAFGRLEDAEDCLTLMYTKHDTLSGIHHRVFAMTNMETSPF